MKKIGLLIKCQRITLFAALWFVILPTQAAEQKPVGVVRGVVSDAASGEPLSAVTVFVIDSDPAVGTTTDVDGRFALTGLTVGRYNIHVSCIG